MQPRKSQKDTESRNAVTHHQLHKIMSICYFLLLIVNVIDASCAPCNDLTTSAIRMSLSSIAIVV